MYGAILFMCGLAWEIERRTAASRRRLAAARAVGGGRSRKEWLSLIMYALAIGVAFLRPPIGSWIACGRYALVALIWLRPDRRIEREISAVASA